MSHNRKFFCTFILGLAFIPRLTYSRNNKEGDTMKSAIGITVTLEREIARREGITERAVRNALRRAEQTLEKEELLGEFARIVDFVHNGPEDFHPIVQCGSFECLTDIERIRRGRHRYEIPRAE
jgi:hypothetical protein